MDSWKEPIYRHEKKKGQFQQTISVAGQGKQCAWPEKLKSVMHRLNSILSHEKRKESSGLAGKLAVSELCATDGGTDIQSITLHENQLAAKPHHRRPRRGQQRAAVVWQVIYGRPRPKRRKTGRAEKCVEREAERRREEEADWERKGGKKEQYTKAEIKRGGEGRMESARCQSSVHSVH